MDALLYIFRNKKLASYYRALGKPKTIQQLFDYRKSVSGKEYSYHSQETYKAKLRTKGFIDKDGNFTDAFYAELNKNYELREVESKKIKEYLEDAEIRDEIELSSELSLKDVYQMLSRNINVKFTIPSDMPIQDYINFDKDTMQLVNINNLSHYIRYPQYFRYTYICPKCGTEYSFLEPTSNTCQNCKCKTKMDYNLSDSRSCYIYMLDHYNEKYVTRSLVELPLGDFTAAVFVVKDLMTYSLFIVETKSPKKPQFELTFNENEDRLKQLVELIDKICLRQIGKQIYGMTYYKYAILLTYLASLTGMTTYNTQIVGGGGLGKTSTARLYLSTISQKVKVQDCNNLTKAGARGSTKNMKIENFLYTVHEPGLMERNNTVVLDEMLDSIGEDNAFLKSTLGSTTISVEIAGYRTEVKKNSTCISTGNVPRWVRERKNKMLLKDEDPMTEFLLENLWYLDGQNMNLLDRFALLFYVIESERKPDFNTRDQELSDIELRQKLYTLEIDNYFKKCAKLKPFIPEDIKRKLTVFCNSMYDPIHSLSRRELYVSMTVQLHAMINGRNVVTDNDLKFIKSMYDKCFVEVNTNVLDMEPDQHIKKFDVFALKTILATLDIASKSKTRINASKSYDVSNFDDIFETALHYGEIVKVAPDRYRCSGWIDHG